jgi:hypothetical protein
MTQLFAATYMSEPHGPDHTIYIVELARKGCRKLNCSAMPAFRAELDVRVELRAVPLAIRKAARVHLGVAN